MERQDLNIINLFSRKYHTHFNNDTLTLFECGIHKDDAESLTIELRIPMYVVDCIHVVCNQFNFNLNI